MHAALEKVFDEIQEFEDMRAALSAFGITPEFDQLEGELAANFPPVECPVEHSFIPHFYVRTIHMPAGSIVTSKIHMTEHPFVLTKGRVAVWTADSGVLEFEAPYSGITKPGTRRILCVREDTVWTTFHARSEDETTVEQIEDRIILKHENPFLKMKDNLTLEGVTQ